MKLKHYEIHRVHLPLPHPIGDSQVCFVDHWGSILELETDTGVRGVGFQVQQGVPPAALKELKEQFEFQTWPALAGIEPVQRGQPHRAAPGRKRRRLSLRSRCGDGALGPDGEASGSPPLPASGRDPVPGSGLREHPRLSWLTDDEFRAKLIRFREQGFKAMKIKVGHPDVAVGPGPDDHRPPGDGA